MISPKITNLGYSNLWTDMSTILGYASNFDQQIQELFANGEQGFFYDPNDLSTMYQDAVGTIPVTAAEQPLGLMKDKSGRNNHAYQTTSASRPIFQQKPILGSELVVNGDFSDGLVKWSSTSSNVINGVLNIVSDGTAWRSAYQNINVTVGKTYLLTLRVNKSGSSDAFVTYGPLSNESSLNFRIYQSDGLVYRSAIFTATEAVHRIRIQNGSATEGFTVTADDISLKEITGYRTDQNYIKYDGVDDKLITNLPTQLTNCTVVRSVPSVGTQILTGQTIPATYEDNTDHCGLLVINRVLTPSETSAITSEFNKRAGV